MKFPTLRLLSALSLAALLAACGGPVEELPTTKSAASIQTGSATTSVHVSGNAGTGNTGAAAAGSTAGSNAVPTASATMPQPDCAADGCSGPRIIDANAEAWRYAAMQRAAAEVSQS